METLIDNNGNINIPKVVLEKTNLNPGSKVRLFEENGRLVIMPIRDKSYFLKLIEKFNAHDLPTKDESWAWKQEEIKLENR